MPDMCYKEIERGKQEEAGGYRLKSDVKECLYEQGTFRQSPEGCEERP